MVALLLTAPATPSSANEEATEDGRLLVLQAASLIANRATTGSVVERIEAALRAPDPAGVELDKVQQALELVQAAPGDPDGLEEARELLQSAVTLRVASGYGRIPQPGQVGTDVAPYTTRAGSGTTVVLSPYDPALGVSDRGDVVLLGLAAASIALGLYLARRWRPHHSMRQLRRGEAP